MTNQNQPGGTPGRWGENSAGGSAPQPQQGQGAANQYGAATPAGAPVAPAATQGLSNPLILSGAAAVLMVIALIGYFLNWVKIVLDTSYAYVDAKMNGFGYIKSGGDMGSASDLDRTYLIFAALSIIAFIGALVQVLVRKSPATGANMFISAGAFQLVGGVYGLIDNAKDGLSDSSAVKDMMEITKGPGQYIVIVTGLLLIGLGLLYRLKGNASAAPKPQTPAGFAGGVPGQPAQPGQGVTPGQYGNGAQPGQGAAPTQPGQNGGPASPNGATNPDNPYGTPRS